MNDNIPQSVTDTDVALHIARDALLDAYAAPSLEAAKAIIAEALANIDDNRETPS